MRKDKQAYYERTAIWNRCACLTKSWRGFSSRSRIRISSWRAIARNYRGVYVVNMKTGRMRSIFIPEQFKQMEANANGRFYVALREYQRKVVREDWHAEFERLFDYDEVRQCIEEKGMLHMTYQKTDDSWVQLHVMKYTEDGSDVKNANLLIWIFANPCRK